jgi:hypothetical protein
MQFFGELKQMGKKTPKRYARVKAVLHGEVFYYRKRKELTKAFINITGLCEPEIRNAVIISLFQNHGIVVTSYGESSIDAAPTVEPKQSVDTTPSPESNDIEDSQEESSEAAGSGL